MTSVVLNAWGTGTACPLALRREQGLPDQEFATGATRYRMRFLKIVITNQN